MATPVRVIIATRNRHKTEEIAQLLGRDFDIVDLSTAAALAPAVEETGSTCAENAILKAIAASRSTGELVVADDSGLEVDSLKGAPGVHSARYAGEGASDEENVAKLLREMQATAPDARRARFRCVLALAQCGRILQTVEGTLEGSIATAARGENGFGYDPVFVPEGFDLTLGEMGAESKNTISHRARAVAALKEAL
jgi:XTP/dITP diphosphohydrolase